MLLVPPLAPITLSSIAQCPSLSDRISPPSPAPPHPPRRVRMAAAAPFAVVAGGYNMVLVEPAMGLHQGCSGRLILAPVGMRLTAGFHLVTPLAAAATRTSAGGVRVVAGSLTAATGGLAYFGGSTAPGFERASRGPRFVCAAAAGYGDGPVSYSSTGVLAGTAASGRFRAMSVEAKAGDEPADPEDCDVSKVEEYIRKRQGPIDSVLGEIHNFNPDIAIPAESFAICRDEDMLVMFGRKMQICYGPVLHFTLEYQDLTPRNREAFIMIGKNLKMVELECKKGFLTAERLDRAVASLKTLRATSLGCSEEYLKPLNTTTPTPRPPVKDDPIEQVHNYFVFMKYHLTEVMEEVIIFMAKRTTIPRFHEY